MKNIRKDVYNIQNNYFLTIEDEEEIPNNLYLSIFNLSNSIEPNIKINDNMSDYFFNMIYDTKKYLTPNEFNLNYIFNHNIINKISNFVIREGQIYLIPRLLNIYNENNLLSSREDLINHPDSIATFILQLPTKYTGGELNISYNENKKIWDKKNNNKLSWICFFNDATHNVNEITSGIKVTIIYDVFVKPIIPGYYMKDNINLLENNILNYIKESKKVALYLHHNYFKYDHININLKKKLKGIDYIIYKIMLKNGFDAQINKIININRGVMLRETETIDSHINYNKTNSYNLLSHYCTKCIKEVNKWNYSNQKEHENDEKKIHKFIRNRKFAKRGKIYFTYYKDSEYELYDFFDGPELHNHEYIFKDTIMLNTIKDTNFYMPEMNSKMLFGNYNGVIIKNDCYHSYFILFTKKQ